MSLKSYCGKNVNIVDTDGQSFNGIVDDYFFPEDNESGLESIVIKTGSGDFYEFTEETIEKITVI
jgi:hypothetical protein